MNEALVSYPGLNDIIGFSYTRCNGISPGFATITCTPQNGWPAKKGTIRLRYPDFELDIKECVADNLSFTFDANGQLWRITVLDRRWKWRYGAIEGRYNIRLPNGPIDKLDPRTERTPRELIETLLRAMGETQYTIGDLPKTLRPSIAWDVANPSQELANLCDQFGMSIVLRDDNSVGIFPRGFSDYAGTTRTLVSNRHVIADSGTYDPPELPDKIKFVCGASRFQVDLPLECVNDDIDGLIKPIDELSYAPHELGPSGEETEKVDWSRSDMAQFMNISLFNPGDTGGTLWENYVSPRELARAGMFRKYRVKTSRLVDGEERKIKVEGYAPGLSVRDDISGYRTQGYLNDIRDVLPLGAELVEPTFDPKTGWYRPLNCIVWGIFAPQIGISNNYDLSNLLGIDEDNVDMNDPKAPMTYQARDPNNGQLTGNHDATVIPPEQYSIDPESGVITFSSRMVRSADQDDNTLRRWKKAILWARIGITINNSTTDRSKVRQVIEFSINEIPGFGNAPKLGTGSHIIRDDDIFLRVEPTYSPGHPEISADNPKDNLDFIKEYAKERVTAEMRKYQVLGPRAITFAGWVKADLTGDLVQVNYSMGSTGAFTSASLNGEIAALVQSYSERRFLEKIRNEKLDQAMQLYNKLAFEQGFAFSRLSNLTRTGR